MRVLYHCSLSFATPSLWSALHRLLFDGNMEKEHTVMKLAVSIAALQADDGFYSFRKRKL